MQNGQPEVLTTRTLLYFPWSHGYRDETGHADVDNNLQVQDSYFKIKRYFNTEFWNRTNGVKDFYVYIESLPAYDEPEVQSYLQNPKCNIHTDLSTHLLAAKQGSTSVVKLAYNLDKELVGKAVRFMGTENPSFGSMAMLNQSSEGWIKYYQAFNAREHFIAKMINNHLPSGSIGALFIGHSHSPYELLDNNIKVEFPIGMPDPDPLLQQHRLSYSKFF